MAGTISFGGIGSGLDTEGIVTGLVNASSGNKTALDQRVKDTQAAVTDLSMVSSLLSTFQSKVADLDQIQKVNAYSASSGDSSKIVASASGSARSGAYNVVVQNLASEQRTYSDGSFTSASTQANLEGTLTFGVNGATDSVTLKNTDSLNDIADKINSRGLKVSASVFSDGTNYRLMIRGNDTGKDNAVQITQEGFDIGLEKSENTKQKADNARVLVDGFLAESATNQMSSVIPGVTLALKEASTTAVRVEVSSDPAALKTKLQGVVDAYNAVVNKVHGLAGFGTMKGTNQALAGDSSLRSVTSHLTEVATNQVGNGTFQTLRGIGLKLQNDGTLTLDASKLTEALAKDPTAVATFLAGDDKSSSGVMDKMREMVDSLAKTGSGSLVLRRDALSTRAKDLQEASDREQSRLDKYAESLRKQFTSMDTAVASSNATLSYLTAASSSTSSG